MRAYFEVEQQTEEWRQLKWGKVGGTLADGLFNGSEALFYDIASQYYEEFTPSDPFSNSHMERGNEMEEDARAWIAESTGIPFERCGWWQSEEVEILGLSPDGCTADLTKACEIKCLGRKEHFKALVSQEIPKEYVRQCVHYFAVNPKLDELHFVSFRPEAPQHFEKLLTPDSLVDVGLTEIKEIPQTGKNGQPIKPKTEKVKKLITIREAAEMARKNGADLLAAIRILGYTKKPKYDWRVEQARKAFDDGYELND